MGAKNTPPPTSGAGNYQLLGCFRNFPAKATRTTVSVSNFCDICVPDSSLRLQYPRISYGIYSPIACLGPDLINLRKHLCNLLRVSVLIITNRINSPAQANPLLRCCFYVSVIGCMDLDLPAQGKIGVLGTRFGLATKGQKSGFLMLV